MRTLILLCATAIAFMIAPAFAVPLSCNPAVQNWQNGSQDTCPYAGGNSSFNKPVNTYIPRIVEEEPVEVFVVD